MHNSFSNLKIINLPRSGSAVLLALLLTGCMGSPQAEASLDQMEIGTSLTSAESLPAIPMGRPSFHATNPSEVAVGSGKVQLVEFFAYWCTVCKAMAPTVHGLEDLYKGQVEFIYLDREDPATQALRDQFGYIYQPHFFLVDGDGTVLGEWRGYVDGEILQLAIVEAIQ
jgi:thiol-disulfide isomerase/thioredoxin